MQILEKEAHMNQKRPSALIASELRFNTENKYSTLELRFPPCSTRLHGTILGTAVRLVRVFPI